MFSNPLFDRDWYLEKYPDVAASGVEAELHYRRHGIEQGRDPNRYFATSWYLAANREAIGHMNPLDHYLVFGGFEGRDPSPRFSSSHYLTYNGDVRQGGLNPLL